MKNKLILVGILILICANFPANGFGDELEPINEAAPAAVEAAPVTPTPPPLTEAQKRHNAFVQELVDRSAKLQSELVALPTKEAKEKRIEEYKVETANRIHEFMASEKSQS